MNFDVSVVVPAKNRAGTLPYCIESVLAQTYPAREIIVVDDHSTDETRSVVERYGPNGVRYEPLLTGRGAQAARNHGIRLARHAWIAFQDSDDRWLPGKLAAQVSALAGVDAPETKVVHTSGLRIDPQAGTSTPMVVVGFDGDCYARLLVEAGPMFPGMLVHKTALEKIGYLDAECPSYQEWDTAIRLSRECEFIYVMQPLFEWVCHTGDTISKDLARGVLGHRYVLLKHREEILRVHGEAAWRLAVSRLVLEALRCRANDLASLLAREHLPAAAVVLTDIFARMREVPRGGGRLMRWASQMQL